MDMMIEYYKQYWQNYVKFNGRARRSAYWYPVLCNAIIMVVLAVLIKLVPSLAFLSTVFCLATLLPNLVMAVRRLHDVGKAGWWLFLGLVPLVGGIVLLVWACTDSNPGENQYGPNPKGVL